MGINFKRLGIVVGHELNRPGAWSEELQLHEYDYNRSIADLVEDLSRPSEIEAKTFLRNPDLYNCYAKVNEWCREADSFCAIELHFNASVDTARGTETLYDEYPVESERLASLIQGLVCITFNRVGKYNRGSRLLHEGDRGHYNMALAKVPSCIVEPFFGTNSEDATLGATNKLKYAGALLDAARMFLREL